MIVRRRPIPAVWFRLLGAYVLIVLALAVRSAALLAGPVAASTRVTPEGTEQTAPAVAAGVSRYVAWIDGPDVRAAVDGRVLATPLYSAREGDPAPANVDVAADPQFPIAAVVFDAGPERERDILLVELLPGAEVGVPYLVDGDGHQADPTVAATGRRDFVVAWIEHPLAPEERAAIGTRRFPVGSTYFGTGVPAPSQVGGVTDPAHLDLASFDGELVLAFDDADADGGRNVLVSTGRATLGRPQVQTVATAGDQVTPAVAVARGGTVVLAWADEGSAIQVRRRVGGLWGPEVPAHEGTSGTRSRPSIVVTSGSDHVVLWEEGGGAAGRAAFRRFRAVDAGQPFGPQQAVDDARAAAQRSPVAALDGPTRFLVVFEADEPGGTSLFQRPFRFNDVPVATDDGPVPGTEDQPLTVDVLDNDDDGDADPLTVEIAVPPANGTAAVGAGGRITYSPAAHHSGPDRFEYRITDPAGASDVGTVQIELEPVPDAPDVHDQRYLTRESTRLHVPAPGLLTGATDADEGQAAELDLRIVTQPAHGRLEHPCGPSGEAACPPETAAPADGSFAYTPAEGFCDGTVSFVFEVRDADGRTDRATATIEVPCTHRPPIAVDDAFSLPKDATRAVTAPGILANDSSFRGTTLRVADHGQADHGAVDVAPDGSFSYRPDAGFTGVDRFTYLVDDGTFEGAQPGVVVLVVGGGGDGPVASSDAYATGAGAALEIPAARGLLVNDSDPRTLPLHATLVDGADHGTVELQPDGSFTYTPEVPLVPVPGIEPLEQFEGVDGFTYSVSNGTVSASAAVKLFVGRTGAKSIATGEQFIVQEGASLVVVAPGLLANDLLSDGREMVLTYEPGPALAGEVERRHDGSFAYAAPEGFTGVEVVRYSIADAAGADRATAEAAIIVRPVDGSAGGPDGPEITVTGPESQAPPPPVVATVTPPRTETPAPPAPVVVRAGAAAGTAGEGASALPTPQVAVAGRDDDGQEVPWQVALVLAVASIAGFVLVRMLRDRRALSPTEVMKLPR